MSDSTQVITNNTTIPTDANLAAAQPTRTRRGGNRSAQPREEPASETPAHTGGAEDVSNTGEGKRRPRRRGKKQPIDENTQEMDAAHLNGTAETSRVSSVASSHNTHTQPPSSQFDDAQGVNNNNHNINNNENNNSSGGGNNKKNKKKKTPPQSAVSAAGEAAAAALAGLSLSSTAPLSQDQQQPRAKQRTQRQPKEPQPSEEKETKKKNKLSSRTTPHNAHAQVGSSIQQQHLQGPLTDFVCAICSTEHVSHYAVGPCDHAVCSLCALRMRTSSRDRHCALCKADMPLMLVAPVPMPQTTQYSQTTEDSGIVSSSQSAPTQLSFASLAASLSLPLHPSLSVQHEADTLRADAQCDPHSALLYVHCHDHYIAHTYIQSIHCCCPVTATQQSNAHKTQKHTHSAQCVRECGRRFGSVPALVSHMTSTHDGCTLCMLCVTHRPLFLHEHEIFANSAALKRHQQGKTQPNDVLNNVTQYTTGHPMCEFCRVHLFDATALYKHLQSEHLTCSLCDASMMFRFYRHPAALREHHRRDHFLCSLCESAARRAGPHGEDILCAFAQYEEFRAHMRDWHGERDCQRFLLGTRSHTTTTTTAHGGTQQREREIFDLDLGAANPPPVARARQLQQERRAQQSTQRAHTTSAGGNGIGGSATATTVPLSALVPSDMRIAGRVSGAGIFSQSDRDLLALQRAIDEERTQAERERQRELEREKKRGREVERERERELARSFPALSSQTTTTQAQTTPTQSSEATPTTQPINTTLTAPTPHPLSLVGKRAITKTDTTQSTPHYPDGQQHAHATGTDGNESERERERQREERRAQLAAAFGISDSRSLSQSLSHSLTHTPHTSLSHNETVARVRESLRVFNFSPLSLLCVPLIPLSVCLYIRDNAREVQRLERQIQGFLSQPAQATLHCAPRPARDRSVAHVLAHYLDALSVEYDRDPQRYVCLLKTPRTPQTMPCTFSSVVGLGTGTVCVRETSSERERENVPAAGLTPFSSTVNNAFHAALAKEERESLRRGEVVRKRGPVVYLMLSDELASLWGRPVDRPSARASLLSHTAHTATSTSQSSSFSVTRALTPAALLLSLRDVCERDLCVSLETLVRRVCLAGPNALAFETFSTEDYSENGERDLSAAIALAKLLQREIARGVSIASTNTSAVGASSSSLSEPESDSDVWRFFRVFTDFEMPVEAAPVREQTTEERNTNDSEREDEEDEIDGFVLVEGEKEEVADAWDDEPTSQQTLLTHTTLAPADSQNGRFSSQRVCENWEDTPEEEDSEWQAFLAERREKKPSAVEPYRPVIRSEAERLEEQLKKEEQAKEKEREAAAARAAKKENAKKPVVVKKATNPFVMLDSSDDDDEEEGEEDC